MRKLYMGLRILALIGALFFMGSKLASAATISEAWAQCKAHEAAHDAAYGGNAYADTANKWRCRTVPGTWASDYGFSGGFYERSAPSNSIDYFGYMGGCASPQTWSDLVGRCVDPSEGSTCAAKPDMNAVVKNTNQTGNICSGGCMYYQASGIGGMDAGGKYNRRGTFKATSDVCTPSATQEITSNIAGGTADGCMPQNNLSTCYDPDTKKICAITPRGNKACWMPGENNTKVAQDQKEALARAVSPTVPTAPTTLVNAETASVTQSTQTSNTSTATTTVYNVTYSNSTGQAGTGTAGSTSGGTATGTSPGTGTSGGTTGGSSEGTEGGNCDGTGDCTNSGTPGGVGASTDLYDPEDKTFTGTWDAFKADIEGTAIVGAVDGFFTVTTSGTCPVITLPSSQWWDGVSSDMLCVGATADIMGFIGYFMLSLAAFTAVKWALMY